MPASLKTQSIKSKLEISLKKRKSIIENSLQIIFNSELEELISNQGDYILLLSPYEFLGRSQGGAIRTNNICSELCLSNKLITIEFFWDSDSPSRTYEVNQINNNWIHFRCLHKGCWVNSKIRHLNDHFLHWQTLEMYALMHRINVIKSPSCLWLEFSWMAPYINWAPIQCKRTVLSLHNIEHQIICELPHVSSTSIKNFKASFPGNLTHIKRSEESYIKIFNTIITTTEKDATYCRSINKKCEALVAPNIITTKIDNLKKLKLVSPSCNSILKLVFVGDCHYSPNRLGLEWFIENIVDKCTSKISSMFKVDIFGKGSLELSHLTRDNVSFNGFAEDLESVYDNCDISLIPLLHGGGSRLKAFEAIQRNKIILSTPKGVEGIQLSSEMEKFIFYFNDHHEWTNCMHIVSSMVATQDWESKLVPQYREFLLNSIDEFKSAVNSAKGVL